MKRNASFYADAILPPTIDSAGHRHEDHEQIVAFVGFYWKLGLGSWESGPGSCLFAGAEDAQRLHAHLMIREGTGRLNLPTDIRGQTIRGSPVNEFDGR